MKNLLTTLLVAAAALTGAAPAAADAPYHPDTIITESYYGEGVQRVEWFNVANLNSPNVTIAFECRVDGGDWYACGLYPGLPTYEYLNGLAPGKHTFRVRSVVGGVRDKTPAKDTFWL